MSTTNDGVQNNCLHIDKKIAERPSYHQHLMKDTKITVGQRVMQEFERRCAAGEPSWPPNGTCLRRIWIA